MTNVVILSSILGALASCTLALVRNRNGVGWFLLGGLLPVLSVLVLCALEPLGPDGNLLPRCCHHCGCDGGGQ